MEKYLCHVTIISALVWLILFITDNINGGMMLTDRTFAKWAATAAAVPGAGLCVAALLKPHKKRKGGKRRA